MKIEVKAIKAARCTGRTFIKADKLAEHLARLMYSQVRNRAVMRKPFDKCYRDYYVESKPYIDRAKRRLLPYCKRLMS